MTVTIRMAKLADAAQLLAIYQPYVEETAISFEYQVPSLDIFKERLSKTLAFYPFLVVEEDNQILGYAYASPFHVREAYAWSAEVSIYLGMGAWQRLRTGPLPSFRRLVTRNGHFKS